MTRAHSFAAVRVLGHITERRANGFDCDFHPDDVAWMIDVVTLAVELRWANRSLLDLEVAA